MAYIVDPNEHRSNVLPNVSYDYDYPNGLNLKPGSKIHNKIVAEVLRRARDSYEVMSSRHNAWREIDRVLTAYVRIDETEKAIKEQDSRTPVSVVVPYSYATLETILTYFTAALLNDPIFTYKGVGPEDSVGALLLTHVINQQAKRGKLALQLHTLCRDSLAYGIGPVGCTWERKLGKKTVKISDGFFTSFLGQWVDRGYKKQTVETVVFEGNSLINIDPYAFLPDPSVSAHKLQDSEFIGWVERTNLMDCLSQESMDPENVFNMRYLRHISCETSLFSEDQSARKDRHGGELKIRSGSKNYVDKVHMYVKLIPKDWGLGTSEYPEKWYFVVAGDSIVVEARPLELNHDSFPIVVGAPDYDGYSISPVSRIEMIFGLQGTLDWLFSSHIANVRKAINDMLIIDPYLVNIDDLKNPGPGKLVRLRRAAWGKGVNDAVKQLQVNDVTRGHIADAGYITDLINRTSAVSDGLMGVRRQGGERISATEAQGDRTAALSRLERLAKVMSMQAFHDIGYIFASHIQQFMSEDTYVNIVGEVPKDLQEIYQPNTQAAVSPFDLLVNFDIEVKDGTVPGGSFSQVWVDLFQIMAQNPEVGQQFDMVRVFKHIAVGLGAKDVNSFVRQGGDVVPMTMDNEEVLKQVDAGNIAPVQEVLG